MTPESVNILVELAKLGPTVGILIWLVYYFKGEISLKNQEIKDLNQALRDSQKETLLAIQKMTDVIGDLKDIIREKIK